MSCQKENKLCSLGVHEDADFGFRFSCRFRLRPRGCGCGCGRCAARPVAMRCPARTAGLHTSWPPPTPTPTPTGNWPRKHSFQPKLAWPAFDGLPRSDRCTQVSCPTGGHIPSTVHGVNMYVCTYAPSGNLTFDKHYLL